MRVILVLIVLAFLVMPGSASARQTREAQESNVVQRYNKAVTKQVRLDKEYRCTGTKPYLVAKRQATWKWQDAVFIPRTRTSYRDRSTACGPYLKWLAQLWAGRAEESFQLYVSLSSPADAVCHVFGIYCTEALAVASCESHLTTTAQNGQYLGMFQMGSSERRIYGHSNEPLGQARAAYGYFVASGRDWSPWSCKP